MASRVAALLLLGIICFFGFTTGEVMKDCCLKTTNKRLPPVVVRSYEIQRAGDGCESSATVITTKTGRKLCLMHPDDNDWVRGLLRFVDQRKQ